MLKKVALYCVFFVGVNGTGMAAALPPIKADFDLAQVPLSSVRVPPFPVLEWPSELLERRRTETGSNAGDDWIIAGRQLRAVAGKITRRHFTNKAAKLGPEEARRHYQAAIAALGGVKINLVGPDDPGLLRRDTAKAVASKLQVPREMSYDAYLIRTVDRHVWITLMGNDGWTYLRIVDEEAAARSLNR